jgi:hypothetical protein
MTYETEMGGRLARRRSDDTISTLRDGISHHFEAALATIRAAASHREELLRDYLAYRRSGSETGKSDKMKRVYILAGKDPNRAAELAAHLLRSGIEVAQTTADVKSDNAHRYLADKPGSASAATIPAGSLVIDLAQPQGRMARADLEPDADFEPEFVKEQYARRERNDKKNENERKEGYEFYDITAWALPYAYGLDAYWTEDSPSTNSRPLKLEPTGDVRLDGRSGGVQGGRAKVAYLFKYDRDSAAFLALKLLQEGFHLMVATKPMKTGGREWPRGTMAAWVSRNPDTLPGRIETLSREAGVDVVALNSAYGDESQVGLGSEHVDALKKPSILVVAEEPADQSAFGSVWYLLERQAGVAFTSVRARSLTRMDLSRYNVIIFPDGAGYAGALGKPGIDALKAWVNGGGVLIGLGGGGLWFTEKDAGISTATKVGEEPAPSGEQPKPPATDAAKKPKKPVDLPGVIMRATIDPTHFLGYGFEDGTLPVPLSGDVFLKKSAKGANPVWFGAAPNRLSGFVWPDNTEELLANTAYVVDEPMGRGHAILYLFDPTFRAAWPGLRRLFLSAILFGPSRTPLVIE